jgi:putative hemolysin
MSAKALHIVETLICERAPGLTKAPVWPLIRPLLYKLLGFDQALKMADAIAGLSGDGALIYVARLLSLKIVQRGLDHLPTSGRCLVVANHPTGIADGVALYEAVTKIRDDVIFFANADALRVCPRLSEVVIPVEWVEAKRTRDKTRATLARAREAFTAERCVVMFPAGRLAVMTNGKLADPQWATTCIALAQKNVAPLVPVHVKGPHAFWFHNFDKLSKELRDITLFQELLNKKDKPYDLIFGPMIRPENLTGEVIAQTLALKTYIEQQLPLTPDQAFAPV